MMKKVINGILITVMLIGLVVGVGFWLSSLEEKDQQRAFASVAKVFGTAVVAALVSAFHSRKREEAIESVKAEYSNFPLQVASSSTNGLTRDDHTPIVEFPYRLNRLQMIGLSCLFTLSSIMVSCFALGLDLDEQIQDGRGGDATADQRVFFGILAVFLWILAVLSIVLVCYESFASRRVALTAKSVLMPRPSRSGISSEEIEIPFASIIKVSIVSHQYGNVIRLDYQNKRVAYIQGSMIAKSKDFWQLHTMLEQAVDSARACDCGV